MIEFRYVEKELRPVRERRAQRVAILQVRHLYVPVKIASGDIVLRVNENPQWMDVETTRE